VLSDYSQARLKEALNFTAGYYFRAQSGGRAQLSSLQQAVNGYVRDPEDFCGLAHSKRESGQVLNRRGRRTRLRLCWRVVAFV